MSNIAVTLQYGQGRLKWDERMKPVNTVILPSLTHLSFIFSKKINYEASKYRYLAQFDTRDLCFL